MNHLADVYVAEPKTTIDGETIISVVLVGSNGAKGRIENPQGTREEIRAAETLMGFEFDARDLRQVRRACKSLAQTKPKQQGETMFVILDPSDKQRLVDELGRLLQFKTKTEAEEYLVALQEDDEFENYEVNAQSINAYLKSY